MSHQNEIDEQMMRRVLLLARRGKVWVAPNPMVGAVVVKNGKIIGEGYHRRFGGPHAEINALAAAGSDGKGAELYVNLEPCCHFGKTPPCTVSIIQAGIRRLVASIQDPNPKVNGKGFNHLRDAGIQVEVGVLEDQARELNNPYLKKTETGKTWVTLKIAQTLDGRIASKTGHSQWITGKAGRRYAHLMRATHDAVLVGAGTVHADDPLLDVRHVAGRNPVRIVLDTNFSLPPECKLLNTPDTAPTWIFGAPDNGKMPDWADRPNVRAVILKKNDYGCVSLHEMLEYIAEQGIMSLMVEGGSKIWTAFLDQHLVDKVEVVIAPIILGQGIDAIQDLGVLKVHDAVRLDHLHWRRIGSDLHIVSRVSYSNIHEGHEEIQSTKNTKSTKNLHL